MHALTTLDIVIRFAVALGLASVIGLERTLAGKMAGMRTYAMVAIGACTFVIVAILGTANVFTSPSVNPFVLPAAIVTGIGFIGAGLVFFRQDQHTITGLTTAAGLWVAAGLGMASGFGFFMLAVVATVAALVVFTVLWIIEQRMLRISKKDVPAEVVEKK